MASREKNMDNEKYLTSDKEKALKLLSDRLDGKLHSHLNSCVRCGLCGESCHYYLSSGDERYIPGNKVRQIERIYRRYHTVTGRLLSRWVGARDFDDGAVDEMVDVIFGACTMCGRCSQHCSVGVDVPFLVRTARAMLVEMELVPAGHICGDRLPGKPTRYMIRCL